MPTITRKPKAESRPARAAFTLVELMIASALSAAILAGVLTAFLFLGRTGVAIQNYSDMEAQARGAMETFALDARMAYEVTWNSTQSVTLTTESGGTKYKYTYSYSSTQGTFSRQQTSPSTGAADVLISNIRPGTFAFTAYKINTEEIDLGSSNANGMTKQIQISLEARRTATTVATMTNKVVSARFVLRNKKVTA